MVGCQIVTFLHSFLFLVAGSAPEPLNTRVNSCFCCANGCRRAYFSFVDAVKRPHKVTHFLWNLFAFPQFFEVKGWERCVLDLLMKVKMQVAVVSEIDVC